MIMKAAIFTTLALSSLCALACDRDPREMRKSEPVTAIEEPTTLDQLEPVSGRTGPAVQAIAQASCSREERCNNIGADKKYTSQQACLTRVQSDWQSDLNSRECPGGIDQKELSECLQEIRNDDCNNPMDSLGRFVACRESDICMAMP
jgi:hypothetical protein